MNEKLYDNLIIIPVYNKLFLEKNLDFLLSIENYDVLIIDDSENDSLYEMIKDEKKIRYIKHDDVIGYGSLFYTGCIYARDLEYSYLISIDSDNYEFIEDIKSIEKQLEYSYDIISCSRILENYNHESLSKEDIETTSAISKMIFEISEIDITDPLSETKAIKVTSLQNMELSDSTHGVFLQLFIQAVHFNNTIIEIPAYKGTAFGKELQLYHEPLEMFMSLIESERHLYKKGSIN